MPSRGLALARYFRDKREKDERDRLIAQERAALLQPMDQAEEAEERGFLETLGGGTVSTLGAVGNLLDLPGSSVRDILTLNNPLNQWMPWNWFTHKGRVSGEEMLKTWGARDPGMGWGIAAEIALDPLTYIGAGIAGKAIKGAGLGGKSLLGAAQKTALRHSRLVSEGAEAATRFGARESKLAELGDLLKGMDNTVEAERLIGGRQARELLTPRDVLRANMDVPGSYMERFTKLADHLKHGYGVDIGSKAGQRILDSPIGALRGRIPGTGKRWGLPFAGRQARIPGTKIPLMPKIPTAGKYVPEIGWQWPGSAKYAPYMDAIGDKLRWGAAGTRAARLMSAPAGDFGTAVGQRELGMPMFERGTEALREAHGETARSAQALGGTEAWAGVREAEGAGVDLAGMSRQEYLAQNYSLLDPEIQRVLYELGPEGLKNLRPDQAARYSTRDMEIVGAIRNRHQQIWENQSRRYSALGGVGETLTEPFIPHGRGAIAGRGKVPWGEGESTELAYWPRFTSALTRGKRKLFGQSKLVDINDPSYLGRYPFLKGIAGGAVSIQKILEDADVNKLINAIQREAKPGVARAIMEIPMGGLANRQQKLAAYRQALRDTIRSKFGSEITTESFIPIKQDKNLFMWNEEALQGMGARGEAFITGDHGLYQTVDNQIDEFAKWAEDVGQEARMRGVYGNHPLSDAARRTATGEDAINALDVTWNAIARHARRPGEVLATQANAPTIRQTMTSIGSDTGRIDSELIWSKIPENVQSQIRGAIPQIPPTGGIPPSVDELVDFWMDNYRLEPELADDFLRVKEAYRSPSSLEPMIAVVDGFLNMFKANVTGPHAMYQSRNLLSGQMRNHFLGLWSARGVKSADAMMRGGQSVEELQRAPLIADILKQRGIEPNPENALEVARELVGEYDILPQQTLMSDPIGFSPGTGRTLRQGVTEDASRPYGSGMDLIDIPGGVRGEDPFSLAGVPRTYFGARPGLVSAFNPLGPFHVAGTSPPRLATKAEKLAAREVDMLAPSLLRGTGESVASRSPGMGLLERSLPGFKESLTESAYGPVVAGQHLSRYVEGLNRIAPFLEGLMRGQDPAYLARKIGEAQVLYSGRNFSSFERNVLQRVFPFYKFSRKQVGWVGEHLKENPGGQIAQIIRGGRSARDEGYVPEHVREQLSIGVTPDMPILGKFAPEEPDIKRYLTSLGFMFEDPLQLMHPDPRETGRELLSRMNPLIKYPLEATTGQIFFQRGPQGIGGRPISKAAPILPSIVSNLMGVPLTDAPFIDPHTGKLTTGRDFRKHAVDTLPSWWNSLEHFAMNTPYARRFTELRQATSPIPSLVQGDTTRLKSWLLRQTTGAKMADVTYRTQAALKRQMVEQAMRNMGGVREFQKLYYKHGDLIRLPEHELFPKLKLQEMHRKLSLQAQARAEEAMGGRDAARERSRDISETIEMLRQRLLEDPGSINNYR
jgi:hypothetical protein